MPVFTVQAASQKKLLPDNGRGAKQVMNLTLAEGNNAPVIAEWFTNATTPLPTVGSTLEGTIEPSDYGPKFKKAGGFTGGGGGGPRQRDPRESAQIQRQHSQEMALRYAAIRAEKEMLPEPFKLEDLRAVIDWFEKDIEQSVALRPATDAKGVAA